MEHAPQSVGGIFDCFRNQLTSLKGAPQSVGGDFDCSYNQLTSLKGAPQSVGGYFDCSENQLTSLKGVPKKCCYLYVYNFESDDMFSKMTAPEYLRNIESDIPSEMLEIMINNYKKQQLHTGKDLLQQKLVKVIKHERFLYMRTKKINNKKN